MNTQLEIEMSTTKNGMSAEDRKTVDRFIRAKRAAERAAKALDETRDDVKRLIRRNKGVIQIGSATLRLKEAGLYSYSESVARLNERLLQAKKRERDNGTARKSRSYNVEVRFGTR